MNAAHPAVQCDFRRRNDDVITIGGLRHQLVLISQSR